MILSFDSGTTNTKAFLFDKKGEMIDCASSPTKTYCSLPGFAEQQAEDWWESAIKASEKLYSRRSWKKKDIEAIGISSQGGTFAILDSDSRPLRPALTWLDNRAEKLAEEISSNHCHDYYYKRTGHYLRGWSPPAACSWLRINEPDTFARTSRISFVADYLNYKITDSFFLDPTSAQMSCFYNISEGNWDKNIIDESGIKGISLPCVKHSSMVGGHSTQKASELLNVLEGTPVAAGGHDQYCASIGAGAEQEGDCLLSCGTAWVLLLTSGNLVFLPRKGWTPGRHVKEGNYGLMASIGNAGIILEWMRKNLQIEKPDSLLTGAIKVVPDFSTGQGAIKNISLSTTAAEIYHAAMQSLAEKIKFRIDELEDRKKIKRLIMVGGASKEKFLPETIERITGIKLILPEVSEASGKGAAILAMKGQVKSVF